jgi:3-oxoacyl-[acyl-carrier-protein] synthase I
MSSNFWNILDAKPAPTQPMRLGIKAAGLCCAVGYHLNAAVCAIRASMDHFQQSEFQSQQHDKVVVARLPDDELWGQARVARWIELALSDCLSHTPDLDTTQVPLIWLAPDPERIGGDAQWYDTVFTQATKQLGKEFHPNSGVLPAGRAGLAGALHQVNRLLVEKNCQYVMLVGADTYLDATTINHYLRAERLQVPGNSDGFIPGEAAAAVLLKAVSSNQSTQYQGSDTSSDEIYILGYGAGQEPGRPDGSIPSRSEGLSQALRKAIQTSQLAHDDIEVRMSDQNGEVFFAREAANAFTRVAPVGAHQPALITMSDCMGEVGAATGVAMLAYLSRLLPYEHSPGDTAVLHLADDVGLRCAVVVGCTLN